MLEEKIDEIVKKIGISKKEKEKEYIVREKIRIFLKNAESSEEEKYLFDILGSISWYKKYEILDFFIKKIDSVYTNDDIFLRFVNSSKQKRLESSSDFILATLVDEHIIESKDIVQVFDIKDKKIECNNIYIIDDFIGSGSTICDNVLSVLKKENIYAKKIYIICYALLLDGKILIEEIFNNKFSGIDFEIIYKNIERKYDSKIINKESLNYIKEKCSLCKTKGFEFGYKNSSTCLAINMTSPNSNISILWSSNFEKWIKLLDRDLDLIALENRNLRILKAKKNELVAFYNFNINKKLLTFKEFKILILIYNCSRISKNLLDEFEICNTIEERDCLISNLIKKKILKKGIYFLEIIDKEVLIYCERFEKSLIDKHIREKSNRFF
jgi:hypothetical protein